MHFEPLRTTIIAEVVDFNESKGDAEGKGRIVLSTAGARNVTVLARVESVGQEVTSCKAGDVILYQRCMHAILRDGTHRIVIEDKEVMAVVRDLDTDRVEAPRVVGAA